MENLTIMLLGILGFLVFAKAILDFEKIKKKLKKIHISWLEPILFGPLLFYMSSYPMNRRVKVDLFWPFQISQQGIAVFLYFLINFLLISLLIYKSKQINKLTQKYILEKHVFLFYAFIVTVLIVLMDQTGIHRSHFFLVFKLFCIWSISLGLWFIQQKKQVDKY